MFLVTDVEVIVDLFLLGLCKVGMVKLTLELLLPHLDFLVLLLHQLY